MAGPRRGRRLPRSFYRRDPLEVAPELLGKVLVHGRRAGRIVEVEAYRGTDDPASHAFRGPTPRTEVMFGPPGHLYVYFTYGMHWCANAVTSQPGEAGAVLIRALEPLRATDEMAAARPAARRAVDLANGPAKLCQALGIDGAHDGVDLVRAEAGVTIVDDGVAPPAVPLTGPRVGISVATERPWRFSVPGDPHRSRPW
ncbi:DNA-3-methyladenine glycosylase [Aquihabitans sp. G128]|uniref:DNA-3-methyladenine glycosylase n=1 Tax=Aquihabitans sp. G128 TaxID=2849779 RepID=UPI001C21ECE8|nr:DNA-3-methyladenine glycosylase [Aquihabitans sp. G128]QXC61929.1 DNA-3-methyladenine glycosylase [Aquihabitans sp. G128]